MEKPAPRKLPHRTVVRWGQTPLYRFAGLAKQTARCDQPIRIGPTEFPEQDSRTQYTKSLQRRREGQQGLFRGDQFGLLLVEKQYCHAVRSAGAGVPARRLSAVVFVVCVSCKSTMSVLV